MLPEAGAQTKSGMENYNFLSNHNDYVWMPVLHHLGKKGIYTEMRYNYEELNTASVYIGKSFSKDGSISYVVTPMLGIVFGKFNGGSLAMNLELEHKKIFASMQTQYTISKDAVGNNFFFTWAEVGYEPVKWFFTGVSTQLTKMYNKNIAPEYGILAGFKIKKITIPIYVFNALSKDQNFIIGINADW